MDNHFGGVIWTNHALDRLRERSISQGDAWATFNNPEQSRRGASGNWVYYRTYSGSRIEVVAKQNENKEWLILSVWSKPIFDSQHNYRSRSSDSSHLSIWRKLYNFLFPLK